VLGDIIGNMVIGKKEFICLKSYNLQINFNSFNLLYISKLKSALMQALKCSEENKIWSNLAMVDYQVGMH